MINLKLNKYLDRTNEKKIKRGLNKYIPLYPMLRMIDDKLYVGVMLTKEEDGVWDKNNNVKAEYYALFDVDGSLLEFNATSNKDFIIGNIIPKNNIEKDIEISKYTVKKELQYQNYIMNDIKNNNLPIQSKLVKELNNEIDIDGKKVDINNYIMAIIEPEIKSKVNELVNLLGELKLYSIIIPYDSLFNEIITNYNRNKVIDKNKIKLCAEIMDNYYDGVIGISNFFNVK